MDQLISKSEFKARALEIMRGVEQTGNEVIITAHGKPALVVTPFKNDELPPLERLRGSVISFNQATAPISESDWELA